MATATLPWRNLAPSVSSPCSAGLVDAVVREPLRPRAVVGGQSTGAVLPVRPELRRGVHLSDHAGGDAGTNDAGAADEGLLLRQHVPVVFAVWRVGWIRSWALGVRGDQAPVQRPRTGRHCQLGGDLAAGHAAALADHVGRLDVGGLATGDPDEAGDLGGRHCRRAYRAVPGVHRRRPRQARVAAGLVDTLVWR